MIDYDLDAEHSVLTLQPVSSLSEYDFAELTASVDAHISAVGGLNGVIVDAPTFPGWHSFGAMVSHFRFVHDHHKQIEKVAIVTDSHIGDVAEHLAAHFVSARVRHFPRREIQLAQRWAAEGPTVTPPATPARSAIDPDPHLKNGVTQ